MFWLQSSLLLVYSLALALLFVYSFHRHVIVRLYYKNEKRRPRASGRLDVYPRVTVQLPVYNERYVIERLIRSVAEMAYPKDRLEIQVLDDSTDETVLIAERCVAELKGEGYDIVCLHRERRVGFKAGALRDGLGRAKGEFIALFDADFVPPRDFLLRTLPSFSDADVGMVQARWEHLNRDYSLLTRVQAILLDGHFVMEQGARSRSGMFFNFNGTAGIWRRRCIEEAGGWQHDTLTEDLDLSYRAQLAGWRFVFLQDVACPAEVPVEMNAWKAQQFRWAKGSMETAKKLLLRMIRSDFPWRVKLEALIHLMANFSYVLMAIVALLIFPAVLSRQDLGWYRFLVVDFPLFFAATGVVSRFYICAQKELHAGWKARLKHIPCVLAFGMGIALNNAIGVLEALVGRKTEFRRTPKYRVVDREDAWWDKRYTLGKQYLLSIFEVAIGAYFCWIIAYSLSHGIYFPVPFMMLFGFGFFYVGITSLIQESLERWRVSRRPQRD